MEQQNELIKKKILAELGYLNYMEKNKISNDIDPALIEKELVEIKKRKKYQIVSAVFMVFGLVCVIIALIDDSHSIVTTRIVLIAFGGFVSAILLVGLFIYQILESQKREIIFKILSFFNK